jgi:16S rRNA (guanine966-N2)-methyltransferase
VISGTLRGRRLIAPGGRSTRPTADRIKESVFNILAGCLADRRVLDLYAGTGALGIEALSRGAASAIFIDQAKIALAALRRNIETLKLEDRTRILRWNILNNLNCLAADYQQIDLVFMDPPYEVDAVAPTLTALVACDALAPGARVVIEHSVRETITPPLDGLRLSDQRQFGKTLVSFMEAML